MYTISMEYIWYLWYLTIMYHIPHMYHHTYQYVSTPLAKSSYIGIYTNLAIS